MYLALKAMKKRHPNKFAVMLEKYKKSRNGSTGRLSAKACEELQNETEAIERVKTMRWDERCNLLTLRQYKTDRLERLGWKPEKAERKFKEIIETKSLHCEKMRTVLGRLRPPAPIKLATLDDVRLSKNISGKKDKIIKIHWI